MAGLATAQQLTIADLSDFTMSPTEHQIVMLDDAIHVKSVEGRISFGDKLQEPLANVLVEIQGPDAAKRICHATTDAQGRFKIKNASAGSYKFKTTLNGFKSVAGTIVVSKKAAKGSSIVIGMWPGN